VILGEAALHHEKALTVEDSLQLIGQRAKKLGGFKRSMRHQLLAE
jgi:hypothetical protein